MSDWGAIIRQLVGASFVWGARGPAAYDCWGLVVRAYELAGLPYPGDLATPEGAQAEAAAVMEGQIATPSWRRLEAPEPGAVVALSTHRRIHHVGLWTPFGVLHATKGFGARVESEATLRASGYRRIEYYRWVG